MSKLIIYITNQVLGVFFYWDVTLIDVTEYIIKGFNSGEKVGAVMTDLKQAFDMVDSVILTTKLQWFDLNKMQLSWFEFFLTWIFFNGQETDWRQKEDWRTTFKLWRATRKYPGTATVYTLC